MEHERLFTLEEATNLLPQVRELILRMQAARREADEARAEFEKLDAAHARGNGYDMKREVLATRIVDSMKAVRQDLEALQEIGCELKDLDMGLVDFPSLRKGQVVNLCWKIDEESIGYWHSLDSGFARRQPL
ncbi:MAG TPA: DUF2203 domain-containing protein [Chloroflexia bacterium]|nr:DUF2203 domain-containing protein [Chloroflexia bacterium]